jgi:hypothetical protein
MNAHLLVQSLLSAAVIKRRLAVPTVELLHLTAKIVMGETSL